MSRDFSDSRDQYLNALVEAKHPEMLKLWHKTSGFSQDIQLLPYEGQTLAFLLKLAGAKRALEIGTLNGYSACWIANGLGEGGAIDCLELNADAIARAKENCAMYAPHTTFNFIEGDAMQTILGLNGPYDAIFIDANKAVYPEYLEQAKRLLRTGGLLIADNVFLFGNVYDQPIKQAASKSIEAMKRFNKTLSESKDFDAIILPTTEGMTVAIRV